MFTLKTGQGQEESIGKNPALEASDIMVPENHNGVQHTYELAATSSPPRDSPCCSKFIMCVVSIVLDPTFILDLPLRNAATYFTPLKSNEVQKETLIQDHRGEQ